MKESPPKIALRFLRWFCREDYLEEIEGDLTEVFKKQYGSHPSNAKWKFTGSVIKYFRPEFLKPFKEFKQPIHFNFSKIYFNMSKLFIPMVLLGIIISLIVALSPVKINRENSAEMEVVVSAVKQGGLKDIVFSLEGVRGMYYISHITKKDLRADNLSRRLINRKVMIYYSKPRFLSYLSPMTSKIQITELKLGDEVIYSEFQQ